MLKFVNIVTGKRGHYQAVFGKLQQRPMSQGFFTQLIANQDEFLKDEGPTKAEQSAYANVLEKYQTLSLKALNGGGPKGIERHVKKNKKMLVRDRIKLIIDPGSEFIEIGSLAGFDMIYGDVPAGGLVAGIGKVCGTYCFIGGNDATVKGGTYFPITLKKSLRTQEIAQQNRLPYIYIPDSGGAYLPLQSEIFLQGGRSFYNQAVMSSKGIVQVAVVCGSCTAGGAYCPTMSDEAIVVKHVGKIYLGGPPLVKAATGEIVTDEDLGGAFMHSSVSGCTDYFAQTENEAFLMCRDIVESFQMKNVEGSHNYEEPKNTFLASIIGREHFSKSEVYSIISSLVDGSAFKEFKAFFGPGLIVGTAYIQGTMVGLIANTDEILSEEALKASHFMHMCNTRQIPVVFLQNSVPFSQGVTDFDQATLKHRAKMCSTVSNLSVPKIVVTISACHDDDSLLLCGPSFNPNLSLTWPSAKFSTFSMHTHETSSTSFDAFYAAFNMLTDAVVLPENTRATLSEILRIFKQQTLYPEIKMPSSPILRM